MVPVYRPAHQIFTYIGSGKDRGGQILEIANGEVRFTPVAGRWSDRFRGMMEFC